MTTIANPYRHSHGFPGLADIPFPRDDPSAALALVSRCPVAGVTPLVSMPALADRIGVAEFWVKDERGRMGLGSFKALGAAHVIAQDHAKGRALNQTYVTASAGNHGMSVAAGAAAFGASSVIYIAQTVPESFANRLRETGAKVVREGDIYEDSMAAAAGAAQLNGWQLLSDSSWPGYTEPPLGVMEGYLILMAEAIDQIKHTPTHVFLQAGVGGLAAACAVMARKAWGDAPLIVVVEPEAAPAIHASIKTGAAVVAAGPVSSMGRLDCKEPSLIALKGLARDADFFTLISEEDGELGAQAVAAVDMRSTSSGAAGVAAALCADDALGLNASSRILCILSEGVDE